MSARNLPNWDAMLLPAGQGAPSVAMRWLSPSQLGQLQRCERRWWFSYGHGWVEAEKAGPLRKGSEWHELVGELWRSGAVGKIEGEQAALLPALIAYAEWIKPFLIECKVLAIEQPAGMLLTPTEGVRVVLDVVLRWREKVWIIEHKSTGEGSQSGGIRAGVMDRHGRSLQINTEAMVGSALWGADFGGVVIDLALLPPKGITFDRREFTPEVGQLRQTHAEYLAAHGRTLEVLGQASTLGFAARNLNSCNDFFRACEYSGVCLWTEDLRKLPDEPPAGLARKGEGK